MSDKFFFKGRKTPKPKYGESGYNTKRVAKAGTETNPLQLIVTDENRAQQIQALLEQHQLIGKIIIDAEKAEDIRQLDVIINKPSTTLVAAKPNRNEPCPCGSGNKYKKCCGAN
ncbi:PBPRA1643 family SWIM/SEC-C metal-binding motif protein [Shewanella sp. NIFS-20-20]|uniref:PBPRA1643 family SWIM/SEC-C metal-binding motif protein n=1 Tax=Shewanella sp. NIFS-20-20 TaxID=2853806 RepID=UPI001C455E4F|nr:PBPRA1643 family SWIM/SEC-C metal-binding motif protein [Shewanella sp. NIFS-20-20]MBV7315228.1 SEC-C domain-containing protein [Shewanella sp. NIFS-20-20]